MDLNQPISIKTLILKKLATPTVSVILLMILFSLFTFKYWVCWNDYPFKGDIDQYYSYLVAEFIHHDFTFHFPHHYWLIEAPNGEPVPKVTMGMAILYFPFFILGNNIAYTFDYDQLGYSAPFAWSIHFGTILYMLIGFWYLRKILLLFFTEWVSAITMFLVLFATNLFYYTYREGEMTHSYLFFLFSVFFYHTIKWHFTKKIKHLYFLAFTGGFITLIRPTEILVLVVPFLYQVTSLNSFWLKLKELFALRWKLLLTILLFLIPIIPQLIFWKQHAGQFFFFSYGSNEKFYFADPKIYSVLFGWHKGWFIYTPIAFFMITGLVMMFSKWKNMAVPLAAYIVLNVYLVSCWWDWGFGGAFGMRALVQCFAFLSVPLAYFIQYLFSIKKTALKVSVTIFCFALFSFFISLNIFQMWQIKNFVFHWDAMSKEAYRFTFFKTHYSQADGIYLETLFIHPDYEAMRKGDRDEK